MVRNSNYLPPARPLSNARSEVEGIFQDVAAQLNSNHIQQINAVYGDTETYNLNVYKGWHQMSRLALLALADRIDELSGETARNS